MATVKNLTVKTKIFANKSLHPKSLLAANKLTNESKCSESDFVLFKLS